MSSKSSNDARWRPLPLGRIVGHRGADGALTVRVISGRAERWMALRQVLVGPIEAPEGAAAREVESVRAYRDRLVLKFRGIDGASEAEALRGCWVFAEEEDLPLLADGTFFVARLIGLDVVDEEAGPLGRVVDVVETGGTDLLVVAGGARGEVLVPLARAIVLAVEPSLGRVRVRLPEGLLDLGTSA